jgi:oxygen-dependent protoporphyrinogen oxidase
MRGLLGSTAPEPFKHLGSAAAHVAVVNLVYRGQVKIPDGFGYLIPTTKPDTVALGVVFDSSSLPEQVEHDQPVTRLTVMLGGRYRWNATLDHASEDYFKQQAINTVQQHLGLTTAPAHVMVSIHRHCIPQYQVGHVRQLQALHKILSKATHHRLSVTGAYSRRVYTSI